MDLSQGVQHWVNVVLIWVGFGFLVGMLARFLLPFKEPSGPLAPLLFGILGSVIGPFAVSQFVEKPFNPISPIGYAASVAGAFILTIVYQFVFFLNSPRKKD